MIQEISNMINKGNIVWSKHVLTRMRQRKIRIDDVLQCLQMGEVVEDYKDDYPYPSCLIYGLNDKNKVHHVVCAVGDNKLWIITSYIPDSDEWEENFKTRRNKE